MKLLKLFILILTNYFFLSWSQCFAQDINVNDLIRQLKGGACQYQASSSYLNEMLPAPTCQKRGLFASMNRRNDASYCIIDAAVCLAGLKQEVQKTVPELIKSLKQYKDIDTGDGVIPIKETIIMSLGMLGDARAIDPLKGMLQSKETTELSSGASGVSPREIDHTNVIKRALDMIQNVSSRMAN